MNLETARAKQEVTEQEMQVKIIERQKQIELEEKEILRSERQYDSEVKKKADADRYAVEQAAAAKKENKLLKQMRINIELKHWQKQKQSEFV